ncbi:MAG TPA: tail fiber domain-containing protein, partial [Pyrinomonadaceae bacterium]|nr:tail fiber domain-containing protein [Pyrinomonadaceae bacterium]
MKRRMLFYFSVAALALLISIPVKAQSTTFVYQGSLNTSGTPANGNHDFEFAMFNGGGVQIGSTLTRLNVPVTNGIFAVQLDFGNQFQGADRVLEIRVRTAGGGAFTTLAPRQPINSAPHSIRSLDAAQLGGVAANQYVVSGASAINAGAQFNIGGNRVFGIGISGSENTFVGLNTGTSNFGVQNTFIGDGAGRNNSSGGSNSFFGTRAGTSNTTGSSNTFFGGQAGRENTSGSSNAFFGTAAGAENLTGSNNAFFGAFSGFANTVGQRNSFFGFQAGTQTSSGTDNAFFGAGAGDTSSTGSRNSYFGSGAGSDSLVADDNSMFGFRAGLVSTGSGNSFFGSNAGLNNTTGTSNSFFGLNAGRSNTASTNNSFFGAEAGFTNLGGTGNSFFGSEAGRLNSSGSSNSFFGAFAGRNNTGGTANAFFGINSGFSNTTGGSNAFFGSNTGAANTNGSNNAFFGPSAGAANTSGGSNSFFGFEAGNSSSTGFGNSFFGANAGSANTTATNNSFFGRSAGQANTTGANNAYFGAGSGALSTIAQNNSFFGTNSGIATTTGSTNSFFGTGAGGSNTTGSSNSVFGASAADGNTTGTSNSYFGNLSNSSDGLSNATAVGARAFVSSNNSLVLGSINGINGATVNTRVGIGTSAPINRLTIGEPETPALNGSLGIFNAGGTFLTVRDTTNDIEGFVGADSNGVLFGSITNSFVRIRTNNTTRLTFDTGGNAIFSGIVNMDSFTAVNLLDTGGTTTVCRNSVNRLSTCSSSLRYKSNVRDFSSGLSLIKRLRPVAFNWKEGGMLDLGLVAEDVATVEPLLTTTNEKGQVEGVKYDRVGVVLVNAVNEQQSQIEAQAEVIRRQQQQIDALKKLVCTTNKSAEICKE